MLASEKVDAFYSFLKSKRYADHDPNTIIIVSPNHFNPRATTPQTICEPSEVYFKQQSFFLTPFPHITCEENIFYPFGSRFTTNEHGIGEHLPQIATYFPTTTTIIPLALPSHYQPKMENFTLPQTGETLVIASVDFSHYLPEETAQSNDQISIKVIQS
ncbi:MAG: AmmeMemoRadiSam system protein B [Candidatus Peribacteria bacterium]|jgi:AmmeMemoRadiSam system protein B|nr:AmmeMemoRadiSam system protein B [Candidatus Peribacteria bacterium]